MEFPNSASLAIGEAERIAKALAELESDPHAASELLVKVTLHVHHEYPKLVGETVVNSAEEEAAAAQAPAPEVPVPAPVQEEAPAAKEGE